MPTRSTEERREAATHIAYEWITLAEHAAALDAVQGARSEDENARLEAALVHARCLINFMVGGTAGTWHPNDMRPADFLAGDWLPSTTDDEELRGYLPIINENLQHLSWSRVDDTVVILPVGKLAHLVSWHMGKFVEEAERQQSAEAAFFRSTATRVVDALPPRREWRATAVKPAPPRKK